MIEFAKIHSFYNNFLIKIIRLCFLLGFLFLLLNLVLSNELISYQFRSLFFVLSLFLIFETFYHFKILQSTPSVLIKNNNTGNFLESFTLLANEAMLNNNSGQIIKKLLFKKEINFILEKANIEKNEIKFINISKNDLIREAINLTKNANGKFVTTMDIFAAYLILTEENTNLLFSKKIKKEEFLNILYWARIDFPNQEDQEPLRVRFIGEGIGEDWASGWMLESKKYTMDLLSKVFKEKPVLVGRKDEFRQTVEALCKTEKNNVILVGESGTGKTTLVESLAYESFSGNLPKNVYHKRFYELLVNSLLAGIQNQGDLEARLKDIIEELSHSGNVILFIPEVENIFGSSSFHLDMSGALFPYLKNGKISIIATVTPGNYKLFIEQKQNISDFFEMIKLEEPDQNTAIQMVLEKSNSIEKKARVSISYNAVVASCNLAKRFVEDKFLPGSAVLLLTNAASKVSLSGKKKVEEEDIVWVIEEKTKIAVSKPKEEEKELLLHLEDKLHEHIVNQKEAVSAIAQALRRLRSGISSQNKPISFLFLGPTGVGKTETAKSLASLYFGGENKMIRLDMSEYTTQDGVKRLLGAPPGEGEERGELTDKVHDNPFSLILLDEFEKANHQILDLFLQVLEDGRLTDNKGKTVSFVNSIIIATSNAASEFIREEIEKGSDVDKNFQQKLLEFLQTSGIFKPELLNRFDQVIVFTPLTGDQIIEIVKLLLAKVSKKLLEQDITLVFDDKIIEKIAKEGFDRQFGARPLRRFIQDKIEDLLAQKMLKDEVKRGNKVFFSVDELSQITVVIN